MPEALNDTQRLAAHAGLKLVEMNDNRGGRFRVQRGRDILHHADDLQDVQGFICAWMGHVDCGRRGVSRTVGAPRPRPVRPHFIPKRPEKT